MKTPTVTAALPVYWLLFVIVVTILPDRANSMGTPTSIFGIMRRRWIFAGAVNEQQMERFEKRNGGMTILHSFPSDSTTSSDGSNSKVQR